MCVVQVAILFHVLLVQSSNFISSTSYRNPYFPLLNKVCSYGSFKFLAQVLYNYFNCAAMSNNLHGLYLDVLCEMINLHLQVIEAIAK